jgi:hypothetical protein
MPDNTPNTALRTWAAILARRRPLRARLPLDRATPLNEEGAFDGDVAETQLAHDTEKEALVARRGGAAPAWQDQEQDPRHL